jgi:hypothetical protein
LSGVDHFHCPNGCDHAMFMERSGRTICAECWFDRGDEAEMVPCTPAVCPGVEATVVAIARAITER